MPSDINITHIVFNRRAIRFTTFLVDECDINIGKIELTYFSESAIEPYTRYDTMRTTMPKTEVFILEAKLSNILGPVLKKLA